MRYPGIVVSREEPSFLTNDIRYCASVTVPSYAYSQKIKELQEVACEYGGAVDTLEWESYETYHISNARSYHIFVQWTVERC
jgi:hypothetical protein